MPWDDHAVFANVSHRCCSWCVAGCLFDSILCVGDIWLQAQISVTQCFWSGSYNKNVADTGGQLRMIMRGSRWPPAFCLEKCQGIVWQIWFLQFLAKMRFWLAEIRRWFFKFQKPNITHTQANRTIGWRGLYFWTKSGLTWLPSHFVSQKLRFVLHSPKSGCSPAF